MQNIFDEELNAKRVAGDEETVFESVITFELFLHVEHCVASIHRNAVYASWVIM